MSEWKAKRFWTETTVTEVDGGFSVLLDGRVLKTPAKADLILPTRALAEHVAAEWDAQDGEIDPLSMPFTRTANAALDKVAVQRAEVAEMLAAYGDSDLLCYRADYPAELAARQAAEWDPYLDWAAETLGSRLKPVLGVMHTPQDAAALEALSARTHALDPFKLAAFHDLVAMSGSLVLGFAVALGKDDAESVWEVSRLDERWQEESWGEDEEATATAAIKKAAFVHAAVFFTASEI